MADESATPINPEDASELAAVQAADAIAAQLLADLKEYLAEMKALTQEGTDALRQNVAATRGF